MAFLAKIKKLLEAFRTTTFARSPIKKNVYILYYKLKT